MIDVRVIQGESKIFDRAKWALAPDRFGLTRIYATCGRKAVTVPSEWRAHTRAVPVTTTEHVYCDEVLDAARILRAGDMSTLADHVQMLAGGEVHFDVDTEPVLKGVTKVSRMSWNGLGTEIASECVDHAKKAVEQGCPWAAVVVRGVQTSMCREEGEIFVVSNQHYARIRMIHGEGVR